MTINENKFKEICEGVLEYQGEPKPTEKKITINGEVYERFFDHFYLDRSLSSLNEEQVKEICRIRETIPGWQVDDSPNRVVHNLFSKVIKEINPETLFELGPGVFPLFNIGDTPFNYTQGELDQRVVDLNKAAGYEIFHFDSDSTLPISESSIDLICGIFVFQFNLSDLQVREMGRILKPDGGILANVYRRNDTEKASLLLKFKSKDLNVVIIPDQQNICRDNEYWLISKSENKNLKDICESILNPS